MAIMIEKQSTKIITPFVQTPSTLSQYKLGFIDEFAPAINIGVVLFFSTNSDHNHNPKFFNQLEKSLEKTLTRFYPLAGRHDVSTPIVDCNDQGAEFTHTKINIKLQDFLVSQVKDKLIDEFIPLKIGAALQHSGPLLAAQVTTFECGGVAIGVSATHKVVDASTLCTLINAWAIINREEDGIEFVGHGSSSSSFFPARGLSAMPGEPVNDDMLNKHTRKKISFRESVISNMKAKGKKRWSKVQLISAIIWKTFIDVDTTIHNCRRDSELFQPVNLREKMASLIPTNSFGNLWSLCVTECKALETTTEELSDLLSDSVKKYVTNFSKRDHNHEEGQEMVLNSLLSATNNIVESTNNIVWVTSWCKFPFYEVNFGFGKPIWAAPGTMPVKNLTYMMDDAEGNGVEAYVFLENKDVPYFEEALRNVVDAFAA